MSNNPEKKGVCAIDFFCIGFGAIVGVGWAVAINGWMTSCGGPIPAAIGYIVALVMMIPIALCYCELVPMLPVAGGGMAFSYRAFNENVSFISGWAAPTRMKHSTFCTVAAAARPRMFRANSSREATEPMMMVTR